MSPLLRCALLTGLLAAPCLAAPAPDLSLYQLDRTWNTDQSQPFRLESLQGHPVFLAMFFTRCGSICPATVAQLKQLEAALPPSAWTKVKFVLVSFDSEGDTPPVLAGYRKAMGLEAGHWVLLQGEAEAVRELSAALGVDYSQRGGGQFIHTGLVTLLDSNGRIVRQWQSLEGALQSAARAAVQAP